MIEAKSLTQYQEKYLYSFIFREAQDDTDGCKNHMGFSVAFSVRSTYDNAVYYTYFFVSLVMRHVFRWTLCVLVGCCDYASDGPSDVNAASKHDGPPDTTDEPPFVGYHRNGELQSLFPWISSVRGNAFCSYRQHLHP